MNLLISDRDGVLFDTCHANIKSYLIAAANLKLKTNHFLLEKAVHEGEAFQNFYSPVWGTLNESQKQLLRSEKASVFEDEIQLVRINHHFISNVIENENFPFLVTRASLASTFYLLDKFQIRHFAGRVISVIASESKSEVFKKISTQLGVTPGEVTIVDDSRGVVLESKMMGFKTVLYPHFCNY